MKSFNEKVSSLKTQIMNVGRDSSKEDVNLQITQELFEVINLMGKRIETLEKELNEMNEYVTVLDENIGNIEDELFGFDNEEYEFDIEEFFEVTCDKCNEIIAIEKTLKGTGVNIQCPNCKNSIIIK